jgi:uncharacterized protein (TIGR03067 family)
MEISMHWQLLTAALVIAVPAEDKKDEDAIQGTWTAVSRQMVGKKTPEAELKEGNMLIKDGTMTVVHGKKSEKIVYKLDPATKPKSIDLTNAGEKMTTAAIYELDGDTLKLCWSEKAPEQRPTKFASDEDSGQTVMVFKRAKK